MIRKLSIAVLAALFYAYPAGQDAALHPGSGAIPAAEFARMTVDWSEDGGYFRSDNFISNETSFLHIVPLMKELGVTGGAYIGVGPEQNFTYIAKIRPAIAFIIDIRRQAVIQHLALKALFHMSESRDLFLAALLSRPLEGDGAPKPETGLEETLAFLAKTAPDPASFRSTLQRVRKRIEHDFRIPLNDDDRDALEHVMAAFRDAGLGISYRSFRSGSSWGWGRSFPTLADLLLETDLEGSRGHFLASAEDYAFVRRLQLENRIVPVVGDFAGSRAFAAVAEHLRREGYTVSAFYTSNVEQYLFRNGVFPDFVENVRKLPLSDSSLFIRAYANSRILHPARVPGHRITTLLGNIRTFLENYDKGLCGDYWSLVTTDYISAP